MSAVSEIPYERKSITYIVAGSVWLFPKKPPLAPVSALKEGSHIKHDSHSKRVNIHIRSFAILRECDSIALVKTVCYDSYSSCVLIKSVNLTRQQRLRAEMVKETIADTTNEMTKSYALH